MIDLRQLDVLVRSSRTSKLDSLEGPSFSVESILRKLKEATRVVEKSF